LPYPALASIIFNSFTLRTVDLVESVKILQSCDF
jgi:hypothetical protein